MERLKEKSTWVGIATLLAGAAGVALSPEQADLIATAAAAVAGLALIYFREAQK